MVRFDLDGIRRARSAIAPVFLDSPQYECAPLGDALGCTITLKIETLNPVRCFKGRGTETALSRLAAQEERPAAVCASAGNLGQALAWSGASRHIPVTVVAARTANAVKIDRIRALGGTVRLAGDDIEDARLFARELAERTGAHLIEDSLDLGTCEGAGTIGLELLEHERRFDALLIALGGGALATGVGQVARSLAPEVEVIAVQPRGAPAMALSWRQGRVVETESLDTIADGVAGRCPIPEVLDDLLVVVDDVVLVSEESIKTGMRMLHEHAGIVVEPSAALGIATVLENRERFAGQQVATVICGSNVAMVDFRRWAQSHP